MRRNGHGRCGLGMKQVEKLSPLTPREVTRAVWVDTGSPAPWRTTPHQHPGPHCLCPPAVIAMDSKIPLHTGLEWSVAQIQTQQCTEKRQVNVYLYGPEVGFTWAPMIFQSDVNLQEKVWKETHILFSKHRKILRSLAFVSNFVNYCQIELTFVQ